MSQPQGYLRSESKSARGEELSTGPTSWTANERALSRLRLIIASMGKPSTVRRTMSLFDHVGITVSWPDSTPRRDRRKMLSTTESLPTSDQFFQLCFWIGVLCIRRSTSAEGGVPCLFSDRPARLLRELSASHVETKCHLRLSSRHTTANRWTSMCSDAAPVEKLRRSPLIGI